MNKIFTVLLVLTAMPSLLFARFAETTVECDHRYGKPKTVKVVGTDQIRWYEKNGFVIETVFTKGRAVEIFYSRPGNEQGLSNAELNALMRFNAGESDWRRVDLVAQWKKANGGKPLSERQQMALMRDMSTFVVWRRLDNKAEASYDREERILFVGDRQRLQNARADDEKVHNVPASVRGL